jgi:DNA-binding transcriptional LysR family regulator
MELRHLRYFVAVAEELHFTKAAQRLGMSQPPLSQRIRELERELGISLFDRSHRDVRLTEPGALLLEHARRVLQEADAIQDAMRRIRPGTAGVVRAGIPPDSDPMLVCQIIRAFGERAPGVQLDLRELTTSEQIPALRQGELDVGVIRRPADIAGLAAGTQFSQRMGLIVPDDHPLARLPRVNLRDLSGSALITFPREMAPEVYDQILQICRDNEYLPTLIRHARNPQFVQGLVLAGHGVHFNQRPRQALARGLTWRPIDGDPLAWSTSVTWRPQSRFDALDSFTHAAEQGLLAAGYHAVTANHPPLRASSRASRAQARRTHGSSRDSGPADLRSALSELALSGTHGLTADEPAGGQCGCRSATG